MAMIPAAATRESVRVDFPAVHGKQDSAFVVVQILKYHQCEGKKRKRK